MVDTTLPGQNARVVFNRIIQTFLCVIIRLSRTPLALKRPATISLPCLEPKDADDDDCFIPYWRIPNLRDGPTQTVDPVV